MTEAVERYPKEALDPDEDDGTMVQNVEALASQVVGHRIVDVEQNVPFPGAQLWQGNRGKGTRLTLDTGKKVWLMDDGDCCAYTSMRNIIKNLDNIDHVIMGVGTTDEYTKWHIYADLGDVVEMEVGWSCGNPFYYGYGFDIYVEDESGMKAVNTWDHAE
jgi:hypothetical protein